MTTTRQHLAAAIHIMRGQGMTYHAIAETLGKSYSYVHGVATDPLGIRDKQRKLKRTGTCVDCGAPTYNGGSRVTPKRCTPCHKQHLASDKKWTTEAVLQSIRRFHAEHGRRPQAKDFLGSRDPYMPSLGSVYGPGTAFDTFNEAIAAAGFEPEPRGRYERTTPWWQQRINLSEYRKERIRQLASQGIPDTTIARQLGISPDTVGSYRRDMGIRYRPWGQTVRPTDVQH